MYQEVIKKGGFSVWSDYEFWKKWFEFEIKSIPEYYNDIEDFYFSVFLQIANKMQSLCVELKTIIYCIVEKIALHYIRNNVGLINELKISIVKDFNNNAEYS
jgi:hypothetical protein